MSDSPYKHIQKAYDDRADAYSDFFSHPHEFTAYERDLFIKKMPPRGKILECGCGPGRDTTLFVESGFEVDAIDFSESFVQMVAKQIPEARVQKMDMRKLEFPDNTFDGIWASFSFLHIEEKEAESTLSGIFSKLKPNGWFGVSGHEASKTAWLKTLIPGIEKETYTQEWNTQEFEVLLKKIGFEIGSTRHFRREGGKYPLFGILAKKTQKKEEKPNK